VAAGRLEAMTSHTRYSLSLVTAALFRTALFRPDNGVKTLFIEIGGRPREGGPTVARGR